MNEDWWRWRKKETREKEEGVLAIRGEKRGWRAWRSELSRLRGGRRGGDGCYGDRGPDVGDGRWLWCHGDKIETQIKGGWIWDLFTPTAVDSRFTKCEKHLNSFRSDLEEQRPLPVGAVTIFPVFWLKNGAAARKYFRLRAKWGRET